MPDVSAVRIYKVGGSLFDWPELFERLMTVLECEPHRPLLVAGGGPAADAVRTWDAVHGLGDERAHRIALTSLRLGETLLATALPRAVSVTSRADAAAAWNAGCVPVLDAATFLRAEESAGATPLPASWDVSSDSIAAWIAARWPADLVLLKSTTPETAADPFVDRHFSIAIRGIQHCEWWNLRTGERGTTKH